MKWRTAMQNAKTLLLAYLGSFSDPKTSAELFAPDGVLELPYLADLGIEPRYQGPVAIEAFMRFVLKLYPGFAFENIEIKIDTPEQVFAEYQINATSGMTGRFIRQHFFGRLVAENGKIVLLREALNLLAVVYAYYPNGPADLSPSKT
jgi:hypothetical protein